MVTLRLAKTVVLFSLRRAGAAAFTRWRCGCTFVCKMDTQGYGCVVRELASGRAAASVPQSFLEVLVT